MLRAVIFDFDGVIADSEALHLRSFNQVLAQYNIEIIERDYYKDFLGLTDFDCFNLLAHKGLLKLNTQEIESIVKQKHGVFEKLAKTDAKIIEGVQDFLETLRQNNIPISICSGAVLAEIELILKGAQLHFYFEVIVSAEQVKKGKPNPEGFLLALQKLNEKSQDVIRPEQCIVIEDSHWGLEAAKAAGMHTVAITNSYEADQLALGEKVIDHLGQLSIGDLQELCS